MTEKVIHEVRFIETDDGFRVEVKGDKERIKKMGFGPGMMGFGSGMGFGPGMMGFGPGMRFKRKRHRRHGRHGHREHHHGRGPSFGSWGWWWDDDDEDIDDGNIVEKSPKES